MKDGLIKVCSCTPDVRVADCVYNAEKILDSIKHAEKAGAKVVVFPELCITGYTCGDLFLQNTLLDSAQQQLLQIIKQTNTMDITAIVGVPLLIEQKLYNCAAVIHQGDLLGIVPKYNIPNYSEFYEARYFSRGHKKVREIYIQDICVPFGTNLVFKASNMPELQIAVEICEDLWVADPPSSRHAAAGATIIANLSASDETIGKAEYRRQLVASQSARLYCAYLYADAGEGESTTDMVFAGADFIAENGLILAESKRFCNGMITSEIDLGRITAERKRTTTFDTHMQNDYVVIPFTVNGKETSLTRLVSKTPFVPHNDAQKAQRSEEILTIQAMGLKKRLAHTNAQSVVVGVSGGLDSTLALLVAVRACDSLHLDRKQIIAVTMPCFGTTDRTYKNAVEFARSLGVTFKEVKITASVMQHFNDIGHDHTEYDVTFENAQARERTQVLMDIANQENGMVIGTGDLSELALGWATYNGDHMSMYAVNASVPKTLIRYLVAYEAERTDNTALERTLKDILATPVSPELLPPDEGEISQKTEHIVGPYILHDFFLYYMVRFGFTPKKIFRLAVYAFREEYDAEFILSWLRIFYRRFFAQQFKRSCMPDGPKIGSVALSPRGDWRMPSDACVKIWLEELDKIEIK